MSGLSSDYGTSYWNAENDAWQREDGGGRPSDGGRRPSEIRCAWLAELEREEQHRKQAAQDQRDYEDRKRAYAAREAAERERKSRDEYNQCVCNLLWIAIFSSFYWCVLSGVCSKD